MTRQTCLALLLTASCSLARAQAPAADAFPRNELLLGYSQEQLNHGLQDWKESAVQLAHLFARNQSVYAGARQTERFGLRDTEGSIGAYLPLTDTLTANVEAAASGTHRVLPQNMVGAQLAWALPEGYVLNGGLRHSEYTNSASTLTQLGAERYWGPWRLGYTLYLAKAEQTAWSPSHRLVLAHYFGNQASLSVSAARGRELENIGGTGLRVTQVQDLTISGALPLSSRVSLMLDASHHKQGDLYTRRGIRIGSKIVF